MKAADALDTNHTEIGPIVAGSIPLPVRDPVPNFVLTAPPGLREFTVTEVSINDSAHAIVAASNAALDGQ